MILVTEELSTFNKSQKRPVTRFATMIVLLYDFERALTAGPHAEQRRNLRCISQEIRTTVTRHPISKPNDRYLYIVTKTCTQID